MAYIKLDKWYLTISAFLYEFNFKVLKLPRALYEYFFGRIYSPSIDGIKLERISEQLIGSFQPFADIANEFLLSFCPYSSGEEALKELAQPILGIGNVLKGGIYLLAVILIFPLLFIICPLVILLCPDCTWDKKTKYFKECFGLGGGILLSWFIDAIGSVIHGGLQIAFTPAIPVRMVMRGISTLIEKSQHPEYDDLLEDVPASSPPNKKTQDSVKVQPKIYPQQTKPMSQVYEEAFAGIDSKSGKTEFKHQ